MMIEITRARLARVIAALEACGKPMEQKDAQALRKVFRDTGLAELNAKVTPRQREALAHMKMRKKP